LVDTRDKIPTDRKISGTYRVACCQFEPVFLNKEANTEKMEDMARRGALAGAQLLIFPECCVTGYGTGNLIHEMTKLAEVVFGPNKGQTVQRIEALANELDIWIIFGLPELVDGTIYNSSVNVVPEKGVVGSFYKLHLWEAEAQVFGSGKSFSIWDGPLGRVGSLICFDIEFPEAARTLTLMGAHLLAVPTANMRPWEEFQRVYARSRAMENSMFVAVSNCIGTVNSTEFFGGSIIVDPYGHVLSEAGSSEAILVADIDLELINKATKDLDYVNKRRAELYNQISSAPLG
jgi:predicted amidohydrolase